MNMQEKTYNFFQILGFSIRKGRFSCSFLLKEKNQKFKLFPTFWLAPDCICSFALMQKNQKIKAYTPEATNSLRSAKISETRFAQTAEISSRSTRNLLNASYVRPIHPSYIYIILWYSSW